MDELRNKLLSLLNSHQARDAGFRLADLDDEGELIELDYNGENFIITVEED